MFSRFGTAAVFALSLSPAQAADVAPAHTSLQGATWDEIKQLPDWSGLWQPTTQGAAGGTNLKEPMPVTPVWAAKIEAEQKIHNAGGDVEGRGKYCVELGFPGGISGPTTMPEFLFTPGRVTMTQPSGYTRQIYTDGRGHHRGPPTLSGDSIGHWEDGTLIVDTINLHHGNEMVYGLSIGRDVHVTERYHLTGPDTMQLDIMLEGPEAFTAPYAFFVKYRRRTDITLTETDCAQNNRDLDDDGKQIMNLTFPDDGPSTAPRLPRAGRGSWKD